MWREKSLEQEQELDTDTEQQPQPQPLPAASGQRPAASGQRPATPSESMEPQQPPPVAADGAPYFLIEGAELAVEAGPEGRLGTGALGEVRRGIYRGSQVACKSLFMLRTDADTLRELGGQLTDAERKFILGKFMAECLYMAACAHPNIVPFFGVAVDNTPAREPQYLVMQYIGSGSLHDVIHKERYSEMRTDASRLPLDVQVIALVGMFSALEYLAERKLIHRDIKPANILAVVEEMILRKVLLADKAGVEDASDGAVHRRDASVHAPEMAQEEEAKTPNADVFSAGVVAAELSTGKTPNPGPAQRQQGRMRVGVAEEERRADDMAAIRHPEIAEIASGASSITLRIVRTRQRSQSAAASF